MKEVLVLVAGLKKIIRHGLCDIGGMLRYNEIINESDLEEWPPVTTQVESTPTKSGPGVSTILISWMSTP